jgi:hypothetical protein
MEEKMKAFSSKQERQIEVEIEEQKGQLGIPVRRSLKIIPPSTSSSSSSSTTTTSSSVTGYTNNDDDQRIAPTQIPSPLSAPSLPTSRYNRVTESIDMVMQASSAPHSSSSSSSSSYNSSSASDAALALDRAIRRQQEEEALKRLGIDRSYFADKAELVYSTFLSGTHHSKMHLNIKESNRGA